MRLKGKASSSSTDSFSRKKKKPLSVAWGHGAEGGTKWGNSENFLHHSMLKCKPHLSNTSVTVNDRK